MNEKAFLRTLASAIVLTFVANTRADPGDLYETDVMGNGNSSIIKLLPPGTRAPSPLD
jgi:hypothetical protein